MLKRFALAFALLLAACGTDWEHESECFNGCEQPTDHRTDEQPTVVYVPGPAGPAGKSGKDGVDGKDGIGRDGQNGSNGHSSVFLVGPATLAACPAGGSTFLVALDTNDNGTLDVLTDANLQSATICNGQAGAGGSKGDKGDKGDTGDTGANGEDGEDAPPTQFTPVAVIDPCGDDEDVIDEVLLRLADGTILASLSDKASGKNTRFVIIEPGSYETTDGSKCKFSVDVAGNLFDEHY